MLGPQPTEAGRVHPRLLWWLLLPLATVAAVLPIIAPRASADPRHTGRNQWSSTENRSNAFDTRNASSPSSPGQWVPPGSTAWWTTGGSQGGGVGGGRYGDGGHYGDGKGAVTSWPASAITSTTRPGSTDDRSASTSGQSTSGQATAGQSTSTTSAASGGTATSHLITGITVPDITVPDITLPAVTVPKVPATLPHGGVATGRNQPAPKITVAPRTKTLAGAKPPAPKPPGPAPKTPAKRQESPKTPAKGQHGPPEHLASGMPATAGSPNANTPPAAEAGGSTGPAGRAQPNWTQTWRKGANVAGGSAASSPAQNPDGPHAASDAPWQGVSIRSDTPLSVPLIFVMVIAVVMLVAGIVDRRDPKLSKAPRRSNDDYLPFG